MVKYYYKNNSIVIESYDKAKTFSSFLPGIAGLKGIPIWVFYINRGQGIASFGVKDKSGAILEFSPANIAYKTTELNGFRTFIKVNNQVIEPFSSKISNVSRKMIIKPTQFSIIEINNEIGYEIKIDYFGLPEENFGALVRKVKLKNITNKYLNIELLDGCASIFPYGIGSNEYKLTGNLLLSWMEVFNLENKIPYYKIRSSIKDGAEVNEINKGNFYLSFTNDGKLIKPIVDAKLIFDYDTTYMMPVGFINNSLEEIVKKPQITSNKLPCGFTGIKTEVKSGDYLTINTIIGHIDSVFLLDEIKEKVLNPKYIDNKQKLMDELVDKYTDDIKTISGMQLFDEYAKQCYLDNFLRGGYPQIINHKNGKFIYYVYSRKHGDLERDYNWFSLEPEFYSQGNGNYRDINQNRRNDIFFNIEVDDYNIKTFMNLIQIDGYNPLNINGTYFVINSKNDIEKKVNNCFSSHKKEIMKMLQNKFTPGKLLKFINNNKVCLKVSEAEMISEIFSVSEQNIEANFGEGYWIDHWTYNMDLIDSYLKILPDKEEYLLFDDCSYKYFYSPVYVLPRDEKYVLNQKNEVRQYGSIYRLNKEECDKLNISLNTTAWLRNNNGKGDIYQTTLFNKLFNLVLIKFSSLDPEGMGIEMEANKPGWNDAMNGLPGLFGSGIGEVFELIRVIEFLIKLLEKYKDKKIVIPIECSELLNGIINALNQKLDDFSYWDIVTTLRETFRNKVKYGIQGLEVEYDAEKIISYLLMFNRKLNIGLQKAKVIGKGIYPTYIVFEATDFDILRDHKGKVLISHYGLPKVKVKKFKARCLPYFLEGPARALKVIKNQEECLELYEMIKETDLLDKKLKMYKTSESLESETDEIGRSKASFTPGWLERESIFLHMTYKYLLGLLQAGLYDQFFEAMKTNLVPFLEPKIYGRSILENSSFIVSSNNPDPSIHGQGFVPRLSGSNAEFISMWVLMMYGTQPFSYQNGELIAQFKPIIPSWLFNKDKKISFKFLGHTKITYFNSSLLDTYSDKFIIKSIVLKEGDNVIKLNQNYLPEKYALLLREGKLSEVIINA